MASSNLFRVCRPEFLVRSSAAESKKDSQGSHTLLCQMGAGDCNLQYLPAEAACVPKIRNRVILAFGCRERPLQMCRVGKVSDAWGGF